MVVAAMASAATWAVSEDPLAVAVMAVAVMAVAREAAKEEAVREVVTVAAAMEVVPDSATQHVPEAAQTRECVRLAASWWCVLYLPWRFVPLRARLLLSQLFRVPQWMALILSAASRCGATSAAPCRVWHAAFVAGRFLVQTLSGASSPLRRPILRHSLHTRSHRTLHLSWASPSTHLSSLYTPGRMDTSIAASYIACALVYASSNTRSLIRPSAPLRARA